MSNFDKLKGNVKNDAKNLYEETQDNASKVYSDIQSKTESVAQQVKDTVSDMYEGGKQKVTEAEDFLCEYSDSLIKTIQEKPLTSVLMAAGVGIILSKMFNK